MIGDTILLAPPHALLLVRKAPFEYRIPFHSPSTCSSTSASASSLAPSLYSSLCLSFRLPTHLLSQFKKVSRFIFSITHTLYLPVYLSHSHSLSLFHSPTLSLFLPSSLPPPSLSYPLSAKDVVFRAIAAGKHVVTANKALIAAYLPEIQALLEANPSVRCVCVCGRQSVTWSLV
jgi:hypothetical protein